jgi:hypothetical protein
MLVTSSEKFLWGMQFFLGTFCFRLYKYLKKIVLLFLVCELNKDTPVRKWKAGDLMELEDEEDKDYVINSLILKTAVLGSKCVEGERNLVAIKTKGYQDKEFEQPIFSLTLGKTDFVSGLDLTMASDHNPEVEFRLLEGTGPVFITCTHMIELPAQDEHPTMLTETDGEMEDEEVEEEETAEAETKGKGKRQAALRNGKVNGKMTNGIETVAQVEVTEK